MFASHPKIIALVVASAVVDFVATTVANHDEISLVLANAVVWGLVLSQNGVIWTWAALGNVHLALRITLSALTLFAFLGMPQDSISYFTSPETLVYALLLVVMAAAILGDNLGYFLGYQAGPRIFSRPKSRFFHPDQVQRTRVFYEKYGARAIMYARFIPIVRSCTPFIAGVARMPYLKFLTFSLLGGVIWIAAITTLGCQLGQVELVRKNFEKVVLGIILLSLSPVVWEMLKTRRRPKSV